MSSSADGRRVVAAVANPRASLWITPILPIAWLSRRRAALRPSGVRALAPRVSGKALFYLSALGTGDGLWRFVGGQSTEIWKGSQGALLEPPALSPDGLRAAVVLREGRPPDPDADDRRGWRRAAEPRALHRRAGHRRLVPRRQVAGRGRHR